MAKRLKTDWWCTRCRRPLVNEGRDCIHRDTVTPRLKGGAVPQGETPDSYRHDGCGGAVVAGE